MSTQETELEILQPTAVESLTRAEVDIQIATARKYPRSLSQVKQRMLSFATLDEETASGCFYTLPARKGGDGKPLQGPSVRLAEIAINSFQHIRAGSRIINDDGKFITAQGVVHDLENNVCISIEVKRRVTSKTGLRYSDDMIATTGNAACSIALRNAAFRVIPLALVKPVYEAAKRLAIGDGKSLVQRRSACLAHFAKLGVPAEKVCAVVSVRSAEDIQLEQLETLMGYATAIKDGESTVDEVFNPKVDEVKPRLDPKPDPTADPKPEPAKPTEPGSATEPQSVSRSVATVALTLDNAGVAFDRFQHWLSFQEYYTEADSMKSIEDLPESVAEMLLAGDKRVLNKCVTLYGVKG